MQYANSLSNIAEERIIRVGLTGAGAAVPTVRVGQGVTMTRSGVGVYRITFADNPGTFLGIDGFSFRATAPAAVKNYSLTATGYTAPAAGARGFIELSVWSSAGAAVDLAAAQFLDVSVAFAAQSRVA